MSLVTHIVCFKYKPTASDAERHLVASKILALQDQCQIDGSTYLTVTGGSNNSTEGLTKGFDHAFVFNFSSTKHRDYYCDDDPAHQAFKAFCKDFVEDVFVFDFAGGEFFEHCDL
ncbi:hypothetical protein JCM10207_006428 [Rhodosporidiobolus poonsookiae]